MEYGSWVAVIICFRTWVKVQNTVVFLLDIQLLFFGNDCSFYRDTSKFLFICSERKVSCQLERRGSAVVSTSACHAGGPGSRPGPGTLLGVKTWLSTLEIVYLCVFRMRH